MFTTNHFIWIAICIVMIGLLLFFSLKFKFSIKTSSIIITCIAIGSELVKIFTHINILSNGGGVLGAGSLPLHLCSLLIFVILYITFSKNEKTKETLKSFFVPIALIGGLLAIFMATSGVDFAKPYAYQCFIYHAGIIWFALYLICTKQVQLGLKAYLKNILILISLVIVMLWVNSALQTYNVNFFYLVKPPVNNLPILNLNHGWFVYFLTLILGTLVLVTLAHLPSIIIELKNKKKAKIENEQTVVENSDSNKAE